MPKKLDLLHWVLILIVGVLSALFWFTPYTYHNYAGVIVRIHRFSGKPDLLNTTGWQRMEGPRSQDASLKDRQLPPGFVDDLGILK
jgi:hypothetical protein